MATKNFFVHDGLKVRGNTLLNGTTYSSAPSAKLHVKTGSSAGANLNSVNGLIIENGGNSTNYAFKVATGCGNIFNIQNNGYVGLGTVSPNETLTVVGNISASGSIYGNIEDLTFDSLTLTGDLNVGGTVFTDSLSAATEIESPEFIGNLRGAVSFTAKAGEALTKGDAVYISGISGNTTVVGKADADDSSKMPAFGIANESVSLNASVTIINFGALTNFNTSSFPEGTELFVGTTAGQLVSAAPTGESAAIQKIAKVTRQDATVGSITVMGAGRSNAVPNLNEGSLFVGNSANQAVSDNTLFVDIANGNVGLGGIPASVTHGPHLDIVGNRGTLTVGTGYFEDNGTTNFLNGARPLAFGYAGSEKMRITGSGNVGVGTTNPTAVDGSLALEVLGLSGAELIVGSTAASTAGNDFVGGLAFRNNDASGSGANVTPHYSGIKATAGDAFGNSTLEFYSGRGRYEADTPNMVILGRSSAGDANVGIGTTEPGEKLTVSGNISASGVVYADTFCSNSGSCNTIDFNDNLDVDGEIKGTHFYTGYDWTTKTGGFHVGNDGLHTGSVSFYDGSLASSANIFREAVTSTFYVGARGGTETNGIAILSGGNVGIGTTSPNAKLSIKGDTEFLDENTGVRIGLLYDNGTEGILDLRDNNVTKVNLRTAGASYFTGGNVGIGTTNPSSKLHIVNSANSAFLVNTGAGTGYTYLRSTNTGGEFLLGINRSDGVLFSSGLAYATSLGTTGSTALQFHTNNNPRVTVDTSGNVGIGTVTPGSALDVNGTLKVQNNNSSSNYMEFTAPGSWNVVGSRPIIKVGGTEKMRASANGVNIGGSTDATHTLDVDGAAHFSSDVTIEGTVLHCGDLTVNGDLTVQGTTTTLNTEVCTTSAMEITNAGTGPALVVNQTGSQPVIDFQDDGTSTFYIEDGGNVGIGTTDPTNKLQLDVGSCTYLGSGSNGLRICSGSRNTLLLRTGCDYSYAGIAGTGALLYSYDTLNFLADTNNPINFSTGGSTRMTVASSGNVGIGITNPSQKLHVVGKALITDDIQLTGSNPRIDFNTNGASSLRFYDTTNTAERMRIDTNGRVGIGTSDVRSKLFIAGGGVMMDYGNGGSTDGAALRINSNANEAFIQTNAYYNAAVKHARSGASSSIGFKLDATRGGDITFTTAPSAAADANMSQTEVMTIKQSGCVGIGVTNPSNKLVVVNSDTDTTPTALLQNSSAGDASLHFNVSGRSYTIGIDNSDDDKFKISRNNGLGTTDRLTIDGDGNVGIGITNPSYPLDLGTGGSGNHIRARRIWASGTGIDSGFTLDNTLIYQDSGNKFNITIPGSYPSIAFTIDTAGKAGIGTTSPNEKLTVSGNISASGIIYGDTFCSNSGSSSTIDFNDNLDVDGYITATQDISSQGCFYTSSGSNVAILANNYLRSCASGTFYFDHATVGQSFQFRTSSSSALDTTAMTITSAGYVGLGVANPDFPLEVAGAIGIDDYIYHNGDHNTYLQFNSDAILLRTGGQDRLKLSNTETVINDDTLDHDFRVEGDTDTALFFTDASTDRVGIGTTNPVGKLHIKHTTNSGAISGVNPALVFNIQNSSIGADSYYGNVRWARANSNGGTPSLGIIARTDSSNPASVSHLAFYTEQGTSGTLTERMVIENGGNVGIGTTSPWEKLTVSGGGIDFGVAPNVNNSGKLTYNTTNGELKLNACSSGGSTCQVFSVSNSGTSIDVVRILNNGNVGVGNSHTPQYALDVKKQSNNNDDTIINIRANWANVTDDKKIGSVAFTAYDIDVNSGTDYIAAKVGARASNQWTCTGNVNSDLVFETINSGTLEEQVRIDHTGCVGIGTSSPDSLLHLNASSQVSQYLTTTLDSGTGSRIRFEHFRTSGATGYGDDLGTLDFVFKDSAGNEDVGARMFAALGGTSGDNTDGQERSRFKIQTLKGSSTLSESIEITRDGDILLSNGDVGIGTATPSSKFHVVGESNLVGKTNILSTSTDGILRVGGGGNSTNSGNLVQMSFGFNGTLSYEHYIATRHNAGTTTNNAFDFYTSDGTSSGTYPTNAVHNLTLNGGQVGIGLTDPSSALHIEKSLTGDSSQLRITNGAGATVRMGITGSGANDNAHIKTNSGEDLEFQIGQAADAATPSVIFKSDGKVGIGTTDFGTNTGKFFVGGYCSNGSSAIAQFNGFIRADRVITHTAAGAAIAPNVDTCGTIGTASARFANVYAVCTTTGAVIESNLCSEGINSCPQGSVVVWRDGKLQGTTQEYDYSVMGVTTPGTDSPIVMGAEPILVTGDIKEGDPIVTSSKLNHGMKGDRSCDLHGKVIAQALEDGSGESYIIKGMIRKF